MNRTRINFYLTTPILEALQDIGKRDDRTVSDLIREAVRKYVEADKDYALKEFYRRKEAVCQKT